MHFEIVDQFIAAIQAAGLPAPDKIVADGRLHRFSTNGRKNDDAGWYVLYPDGIPAGAFGCWRSGISQTWHATPDRPITVAEKAEIERRLREARERAEAERRERALRAASLAEEIWHEAKPARSDHPYLVKKGVKPTETLREIPVTELAALVGYAPKARGEALQGRILVVPVQVGGKLSTLELIDESGRKSALAGGAKKGGYWAPSALPDNGRIVIAEGVATALSITQATGIATVAALAVGNILAVGETIRAERPLAEIAIAADLDKDGEHPHPDAVRAATVLRCDLYAPKFDKPTPGGDFNDLFILKGAEEVKRQMTVEPHIRRNTMLNVWMDIRASIENEPKPIDFVLPGLKGGTVGSIVSPGGTGKTMFALQLAVTIAGGADILEFTNAARWKPTHGRVIYLSGEDTEDILSHRLYAIGQHLKPRQRDTIYQYLHIACLYGETPNIMDRWWQGWIERETEDARLVIIDTLRRFHTLDENDAGAMSELLAYLESVCKRNGTTIIFLHHASKIGALTGGDTQQASRGSSVLTDNVRWQANLVAMTKEEADKFGVDEEMRKRYVRLAFPKINYTTPIEDRWYRRMDGGVLKPFDIANTKDISAKRKTIRVEELPEDDTDF